MLVFVGFFGQKLTKMAVDSDYKQALQSSSNLPLVNTMNNRLEQLLNLQKNAHCPYSKFQVAAILVCENGEEYKGVNVENASYGGTICAERSAFVSAISQGQASNKFTEIHLIAGEAKDFVMPCGLCRQFMSEFVSSDFKVYVYHADGGVKTVSMEDLLPYSFSSSDLA